MTIKEIQEWEKSFSKKNKIKQDEETAIKIALCKLMEEVGEAAEAVLEDEWDEIQAEISDIIVFACKLANIAEEEHEVEELTKVFKRKMEYCEQREYDEDKKRFNKPDSKEFK